ncbi:5-formyltetrahydrofolate cyclo-ligase [Methylobacterium nigriterrae]|uniref:5-formyltetrahydrofolate cyclo-ligase n=1 Tax=Methylobacterium nigriterrae TaxID=3127512 RepID=UPI0030134BF6
MAGNSSNAPEPATQPIEPEHTEFGEYSSPPCFMHELDPSYLGLPADAASAAAPQPQLSAGPDWQTIKQWRKETRARLIEQRLLISSQDRASWSARISERLQAVLASREKPLIGFYWPFRGEYDARPLLTALRDHGARLALPVVVAKAQPLQFREWWPGVAMTKGVWNIPIPAGGEPVSPDVLLAPLVGFDPGSYRLGYGGGFYDRTIAARPTKPLCIGVGFELSRLATIHPQVHDVPMDIIITEGHSGKTS